MQEKKCASFITGILDSKYWLTNLSKIALKLAVSRIKLLKNKREVQLKQLKRDVAKLLQSGQDQIATIRVEHVVREEKTMTAYDFIEIYCELIAARLPIIESQKNCPTDLKEAISSVIFASPRCADIPELSDVRKHITAKYGKEFVSAAVELRPECGLVEKLSAKAPDGPTKIKILNAIAEEHNVTWEPKSFGENDVKSSHDLQIGPNVDEKASYVEVPQPQVHVHTPPVHNEKGPSNLHAYSQHKEMDDVPTNLYRSTTSGRSNPSINSSGTGSEEMDFRDSYSGNSSSSSPMGRQKNWNMEFKDAASAAQEAAESAERASMAARAALELSNREKITTRKYSNGLMQNSSSGSDLGDEVPNECAFHDGKLSAESVNRNYGKGNEQINAREQNNPESVPDQNYRSSHDENVVKHAKSAYINGAFGDDFDNPFSYGAFGDDFENNEYSGDARMNRKSSKAASHSQFISPSDDYTDILEGNSQKMRTNEGNTQRRNLKETNSYHKTADIIDESGSEHRQGCMSFDDLDGPSSESEEDSVKPKVLEGTKQKHGTSGSCTSMKDETSVDSQWNSNSRDSMEEHFKRKIDMSSSHEAKAKVKHSISGSLPKSMKADRSESSKGKASHVHPKLPDYDSFVAHFLSLKKAA
ncbi:IST1-like protein [Senna tora]|uniref:IST1-like protein n=1 Tax=Senna tora TaxID=362788 RepID=A0A834WEI2_9FABA|nr:IST1-like protein [Senna tora]